MYWYLYDLSNKSLKDLPAFNSLQPPKRKQYHVTNSLKVSLILITGAEKKAIGFLKDVPKNGEK